MALEGEMSDPRLYDTEEEVRKRDERRRKYAEEQRKIEQLEKSIEQRIPAIDREHTFALDKIDHQWKLLTEAIRREVVARPEVRKILLPFCTIPVSERLPDQLISTLRESDERIAKLVDRYEASLAEYLALPSVPDDQITPDISNAPLLHTPEEIVAIMKKEHNHPGFQQYYYQDLKDSVENGTFSKGITNEERSLVFKRYAYARDVKILALQAEILEQGMVTPNSRGEVLLPSGIKMVSDLTQHEARTDLLDPTQWGKRIQLKDRVYEIYVHGKKYILKEKKTNRHIHTKRDDRKGGNLSAGEFEIARKFQAGATVERGDIKVGWEKPLGFATFPDSFQFTVFQFEEGLIDYKEIMESLVQKIIEHRAQFEQEYALIASLIQNYKDDPRVFKSEERGSVGATLPTLTFDEFAMVKALRMREQSRDLMKETIIRMGYKNGDHDGYAFKIVSQGDRVQLEIVGFDFEYYSGGHYSGEEVEREMGENRRRNRRDGLSNYVDFMQVSRPTTKTEKAAYCALLDTDLPHIAA